MGQYPRTQLKSAITEINGKRFAYPLSCPSSFETYPFTNLFHLFGEEGHRYFGPWNELIELIVFGNYIMGIASLRYKGIKLSIQVAMDDKGCIVPMVLAYSIQFHLNDQCVVIVGSRVKCLLHLSSLQEVVAWKLVVVCFLWCTECLGQNALPIRIVIQ